LVQIADFSLWLDKRRLTIMNVQPADSEDGEAEGYFEPELIGYGCRG
jgi:hypothetical protein